MGDLQCTQCGIERSYADAAIADSLRTCGDTEVARHTAVGPKHDGSKHDWVEV